MLPTIATGNVGSALAGEYEVANSLRFDDGSSDSLTKTFGSAGNRDTFTLSAWVKRAALTTSMTIFGGGADDNNRLVIGFGSADDFRVTDVSSGSGTVVIATDRLFRDVSAWYHIVVAYDTTQSTDSDRVKLYVNGVQETSFASTNYPSQNTDQHINGAVGHFFASNKPSSPSNYFDGYMAEVVLIDGQQLTPTSFGESDEDTGIWKPKDVSGLTFGTNGFYLDFEDSSALGNDVSGNDNDFTANNLTSVDQSTDSCTNNFCTLNPLNSIGTGGLDKVTMSEGNLKGLGTDDFDTAFGTMAVQNGVWYYEVEFDTTGSGYCAGWTTTDAMQSIGASGDVSDQFAGFLNNIRIMNWNTEELADYADVSAGDILGLELDLDSATKTLKCYHNGTLKDTINLPTDKGDTWIPVMGDTGTSDPTFIANFGNPIVSLSSANSDPEGYGSFEYSTGSGYSLCTKNLAEYG